MNDQREGSRCHICKNGPEDGIAIFRQNPIGELPAIWACRVHNRKKVDPGIDAIVKIIERDNKKKVGKK